MDDSFVAAQAEIRQRAVSEHPGIDFDTSYPIFSNLNHAQKKYLKSIKSAKGWNDLMEIYSDFSADKQYIWSVISEQF